MSMPITAHIINHTHWDREWFLTSEYTSRWIPRLIDKIEELAAENPAFRFLFDGQTLVIKDLLALDPGYEPRVRALLANGNLQIGPYYCQPDWQLSGGELLIRNLLLGRQDVEALGGEPLSVGWLVDTFGHISQSPQIHRLFGINAVFVWRGAPLLVPYFTWRAPDGSTLLTINLFGGYRNLYGITHAPQVAVRRLQAELQKLEPYYRTGHIPLFDGYDLEDDPEDPVRFYTEQLQDPLQQADGQEIQLREATPVTFARDVASRVMTLPVVEDELNSGKYGATFPGTLSARTYLKIMAHDCERLLFHVVEPLAVMAHVRGRAYNAAQYEGWTRRLLQNAIHDCLCGVSIDQVHEKMTDSYKRRHQVMVEDLKASLSAVLSDFQPGLFAVSTNPFAVETYLSVGGAFLHADTAGIGVWPIARQSNVENVSEPVSKFTWRNAYYQATLQPDGTLELGSGRYGKLVVSRERGDTYSAEPGEQLGVVRPTSPPQLIERSEHHAVVLFQAEWRGEQAYVTADVRVWFDPSPIARWYIELDSQGTDLRVDMNFEPGLSEAELYAGMPFDVVKRRMADGDLLPRELSPDLSDVLLGQRELNTVFDFPFHDFLALAAEDQDTVVILSKGLRSYRADERGAVSLTLRRAVEWVTKADLQDRVGDAGPFFYVPDARCERRVRHEIGLAAGAFEPRSMNVQRLNAAFQDPPLIVQVSGEGRHAHWKLLREELPLSSLNMRDGSILARFYNPTDRPANLAQAHTQTDVWGHETGTVASVAPGKILTTSISPSAHAPAGDGRRPQTTITLLNPPHWRDGGNRGRPDPQIVAALRKKMELLTREIEDVRARQVAAEGAQFLRAQHRLYVLQRELLEYQLSYALNRRKLQQPETPDDDYLYGLDPEIAEIGQALNHLRIKRRIYDYVVQCL